MINHPKWFLTTHWHLLNLIWIEEIASLHGLVGIEGICFSNKVHKYLLCKNPVYKWLGTLNPKTLPIEYWTLSSLKIIKKTNSNNQIQQSHWPWKEDLLAFTNNPILLNIENNFPFFTISIGCLKFQNDLLPIAIWLCLLVVFFFFFFLLYWCLVSFEYIGLHWLFQE